MISRFLFVVPSLMVACAAGAAECVWTGSTGDGGKWSTPGNWRGNRRPEAGDTVVFENASEVTTENDRDGLVLEKAWFLGSAMVTINGNGFSLTADDGVWTNRCAMRVNVPVTFTGAIPKAVFVNASTSEVWFNSPVCLVDDSVYYSEGMGTSYVYYKGGIIGSNATYMHSHEASSRAYIYGGKLKYFRWNGISGAGQVSFLASVNGPLDVANPIMLHYGSPCVSNTGALSENVVLSWGDGYREAGRSTWDVRADQTLNRIESGEPLYGVNWVKDCDRLTDSNGSRTVTLRGTDNAETYGVIWGTTSITWDPVGDFTQTFLDRCHLNTGTLTVNRGTLASAGTNTFGNVSAVVVNGGSFKNTTVSPRSLASVKTLVIGGKGHFKLGPETPNPFTDGQITLSVSSSATLDWPAGMTLSVKSARVDGLSLPVGKYTGKDGTDGEATKVGWISGGGVISVAGSAVTDNEWTGGIDTDWTVAGNWSEGVPSAALPANIYGGTSEIAKAISAFAVLNVGGLPAAAPLLQVKTDTMFDGVVTTIRNGGEIRAVNARMQFDQSAGLTVEKGGVLSATGSSVLRLDGEFGQTGGRVDIGGNSVLEVTNVFAKTVFKTGEVVFRDNAEPSSCACPTV